MQRPDFYRERHRAIYKNGYVNKTISLSSEVNALLTENKIQNISLFINDLLYHALHKRQWERQQFVAEMNALKDRAMQFGFIVTLDDEARRKQLQERANKEAQEKKTPWIGQELNDNEG